VLFQERVDETEKAESQAAFDALVSGDGDGGSFHPVEDCGGVQGAGAGWFC
jgi:hypothetical protein